MIKKTIYIYMVICLIFTGCSSKQSNTLCEYENMKKCNDMENILSDNIRSYYIAEIIKEHSVKINNQKLASSEFEIMLDKYFYNKNTGVTGFKFIISNLDGSPLTGEQYKRLGKIHDNGELYLINERSCRNVANILQRDKEQQVVWYSGHLLSAISPQDKVSDITQKKGLNFVEVNLMDDNLGKINLPCYDYDEEIMEFDVSKNKEIISVKMTKAGVSIIWNIDKILSEFREMIKQLPEGEDPEGYNYTVYKNIIVHLKDGTKCNVLDFYCDEEIREENNIAGFSGIWEEAIALDEVDCLEIDGERYPHYKLQKTSA